VPQLPVNYSRKQNPNAVKNSRACRGVATFCALERTDNDVGLIFVHCEFNTASVAAFRSNHAADWAEGAK